MAGAGMEGEDKVDSEVVPPQTTSNWRSKNNQDRDSARDGMTRSQKRPLPPSGGERSSNLPATSPSHGKVAPLRPKKVLTTLGGRRVNPSEGDASAAKPRAPVPTRAKASIAPPWCTLKITQK